MNIWHFDCNFLVQRKRERVARACASRVGSSLFVHLELVLG